MNDMFVRLFTEPFRRFVGSVVSFLPSLLLALLVLVAGLAGSKIAAVLLQRLLAAVGLDRHAEKSGILDLMKKGGLKVTSSELIGGLVFWLLAVMFAIISLATLNLPEIDRLLSEFFLFLPNVFTAVVVVFVGYALSNFLAKAALVSAVNAGWRMPGFLGRSVKVMVMLLTATMALEQLGIGRGTILIVFSISFGGLVLALALAFGLGAREIAREFLEEHLKEEKKEEKDEISHI
jgi:Mechanosensitive ion channel, conserved TM helix